MTSGPLSWECSQQDLPHQFFLGYSAQMDESAQLRSLYSEMWLDIQGFMNFTAVHFVPKCHTVNSLQKSYLCHLHLDRIFSVIIQDSGP